MSLVPMLPVRSLDRSIAFYEKLGFKVEQRNEGWGWAMLGFGDCKIMIDRSINAQPDAPRQSVLYLYPGDIRAYHQRVRVAGLAIPELDTTFYGLTEFRLDDPDGNRMWVGQREATAGGQSASSQDHPTDALRRVKLVHTAVWAFFASCIIAIPLAAAAGSFRLAFILVAIVAIEVLVLLINGFRCPLTGVAARYTPDRQDNFDIYLPLWLARHNKLIFGLLYLVGVAYALVGWLGSKAG